MIIIEEVEEGGGGLGVFIIYKIFFVMGK
jgi:hypothetical protein